MLTGTIIFSIHQPRYSIYKLFDTLFLLSVGRCVYHGSAAEVLPFFASAGFHCETHENPADFLLDVCQGEYEGALPSIDTTEQNQLVMRLNEAYNKSDVFVQIQQRVTHVNSLRDLSSVDVTSARPAIEKPRSLETFHVVQRAFRNALRNPVLVISQVAVAIVLGVLIGVIYINTDRSADTGVKNRIGVISFIVTNQVFGSLSALELFIKERALFQHENVSGYYHVSTFFIAKLSCDLLPLRTIPSILFSVIVYFMIGFQRTLAKFLIFFLGVYTTSLCASSLCFAISATVSVYGKVTIKLIFQYPLRYVFVEGVASLTAAMFCVLTLIFAGFLVDVPSVTILISWIKWISMFRYSTNLFAINEFTGLTLCLPNNHEHSNNCSVDGLDVLKAQKIDYSSSWDLWKNFVALIGMIVGFLLLTYVQLRRMKKTK